MDALKISVQVKGLKLPLRKALVVAAELGADGVEIDARTELKPSELSQTGARDLRKVLDDHGLKVSSVAFPTRRGYDVLDDLDARVEGTKAAMRMAFQLGADVVVNQIGRIPAETTDPAWGLMLQVLADLGAYGHQIGAWLAARTGNESGVDLKRLISALPEGTIRVAFDPGGLVLGGFSPNEVAAEIGPWVHAFLARDANGSQSRNGEETPLGRGVVDFPYLLGVLEDFRYRGWLSINRSQLADPYTELAQSVRFLRNVQQ